MKPYMADLHGRVEAPVKARLQRPEDTAAFHLILADYECQLGDLPAAKARLVEAFQIKPGYRLQALEDPTLDAGAALGFDGGQAERPLRAVTERA